MVAIAPLPAVAEGESGREAVKLEEAVETSRAAARRSARRSQALRERRAQFGRLVEEAARAQGVRVDLVHAIIEVESAYRSDAVSRAGAVGLMQLMPETARRYGVEESTDPRQNLAGGTAYLRDLHELYGGRLRLVLAAYNAGEEAVARYGGRVPAYPETRAYVRRVMELLRRRSPMIAIPSKVPAMAGRSPEGSPAWRR